MLTGNVDDLLYTAVLALVYLLVLRFLDLNEREPLWSVTLLFGLGAFAALVLRLAVRSTVLDLTIAPSGILTELARFAAIAAGVEVLSLVGRLRGWSELTDVVDGIVYGAAAGLGFATGEALVRWLSVSSLATLALMPGPAETIGRSALAGLSHGVLGAIVGVGFGAAVELRSRLMKGASVALGLGAAVAVDIGFQLLARGNALGQSAAVTRQWIALLLPVLAVAALAIYGLVFEQRTIVAELSGENKDAVASSEEFAMLGSAARRQMAYLTALLTFRFRRLSCLAALHNRQVMLALAKRRARQQATAAAREAILSEADVLRRRILDARRCLSMALVAAAVGSASASRAQAPRPAAVDPQLVRLVALARNHLDRYWSGQIRNYVAPVDVIMMQVPAETDCGVIEAPNAMYCSPANKVYWDAGLLSRQYDLGDFAPIFVIAHEWGHAVQHQLGFMSASRGLMRIQLELQADCLAGAFAADARTRGALDPGDDDEALMSLRRSGDDLDSAWFEPGAHGTPGQRIDAFLYGLEPRSCTDDAFFAFLKDKGIDPARAPQTPTPTGGTLASMLRQQVGRFVLAGTSRTEIPGSTDSILAQYRTPDGVSVAHAIAAFGSAQESNSVFSGAVQTLINQHGYRETKRQAVVDGQGRKLGDLVLLQGATEVVYWTNEHLVGLTEGPVDMAWELYNALPY
jgi:predicted metalloprotease/RsiW-degrading membrane proteinase PrsW (M82 family)